jgi:hypothetical protein
MIKMIKIKLTTSIYVYGNIKMFKANDLIASVKKDIELIVMSETNITKYLDLYNYSIKDYGSMDEYILDNYNYELFGKNEKWAQLETIGHKEIHP